MAGAFEDVKLVWQGREYTIPARNMLRAVAIIEDHVTMPELQKFSARQTAPLARLSGAFAGVLTFAGCPGVDAETIYSAMFEGNDQATAVSTAITTLMAMMLPKSAREKFMNGDTGNQPAGAETAPGNSQPAASASLKKRSSSRSGPDGSRRQSSGKLRRKK
jgi:hypothetical protein